MKKESPLIIDRNKQQVFLVESRSSIPIALFSHPWFVLNDRGTIERWEVLFRIFKEKERWGHVYRNAFPADHGMEVIPYFPAVEWKISVRASCEGALAQMMIPFVQQSPEKYPFGENYNLLGPNSNTYCQWILNAFPEFSGSLPFNAWGKGYERQ